MDTLTFPTRTDPWLVWGLGAVIVVYAAFTVRTLVKNRRRGIPMAVSIVLLLGLMGLFAWPIQYELTDKEVVAHYGIMTTRVAYTEIEEVLPGIPWLAAPAWSLDRIRIDYKGGMLQVSPADESVFRAELARRANLTAAGDRLVPAGNP